MRPADITEIPPGEHVNVPEVMIKGGSTYRLVMDHVGSVRLVVDTTTGAVAQRLVALNPRTP